LLSAGLTAHAAGHSDAPRRGVFGHTLQRSQVQSPAHASLAAVLDGEGVPVLLAQARARLAPPPVPHAHALQPSACACAHRAD
jgi:hypothetical protein